MFYDTCVLDAHGEPAYCHSHSTCIRAKLSLTPGSCFIQFTRYSIMIIGAYKELLMVSKGYQKSDFNIVLYRVHLFSLGKLYLNLVIAI